MKSTFIIIVLGVIVGLFFVSIQLSVTVSNLAPKLDSLSLAVEQAHCIHDEVIYKEIVDSSLYYYDTRSFGISGYYRVCTLCGTYVDIISLHQYIKLNKDYWDSRYYDSKYFDTIDLLEGHTFVDTPFQICDTLTTGYDK